MTFRDLIPGKGRAERWAHRDTVQGSGRVSRLCCAPAAPTVVDGQMFPSGVFLFWSQLCPSHTNATRNVGEPQYSRERGRRAGGTSEI